MRMQEYQLLLTVKNLVKYHQMWIQKRQRLQYMFPETDLIADTIRMKQSYIEGMNLRVHTILEIIHKHTFINDTYKQEIILDLNILISEPLKSKKVEKLDHPEQDQSVYVKSEKNKKTQLPWLAKGISNGKKTK